MTPPVATYRLQFRNGMSFERAAALAPYLARLGVSHLYASPLFAAAPGSTHGYDGIDVAAMEPAIGGVEGFERLSVALDAAGLSLLMDFVPNHMGATETNRWWRSVLEWGAASPFAHMFDVDWSAPKLLLPILGESYDEALRQGLFGLAFDADVGRVDFTVYDRRLPLTPPSYADLLALVGDSRIRDLSGRDAAADPAAAEALKEGLADLARDPACAAAIADALNALSADTVMLHEIHDAQPWRLAHWRLGREQLTYRRFFEIVELICLRVEDPDVFDAVHARLLDLIATRRVAGVRIDHIDGLADPKTYLERLCHAAGGDTPLYTLVEKILEPGESLRADWPVAGTTGYEFASALAGLFVDRDTETAMSAAYDGFVGGAEDYASSVRNAKRRILEYNLAAELRRLTDLAAGIASADSTAGDVGRDALRRAIVALAAGLHVYRCYVTDAGPDDTDRELIADAVRDAEAAGGAGDAAAITIIARLLLLDVAETARSSALEFAIRFQQTSGPVMAKAVEDTVFYRYNRLIALNEVGGAPDRYGAPLADFHAAMAQRREHWPAGLSASATHDTKRGEDARARLYVLSEIPEEWAQAVRRWTDLNATHRAALPDGAAPEPQVEWMFYQALAGAWPAELMDSDPFRDGGTPLAALSARMQAYMEKSVREAKLRTSWIDGDADYETAVARFVAGALSPLEGRTFVEDFIRTCRPVWVAGALNGLAQLAIKLAAPGVPDIYQGCENWDFSLVDPDNRTSVDFAHRESLLQRVSEVDPAALVSDWLSGAPKMALTAAGLWARAARPALFAYGDYAALKVQGTLARHVVAFARTLGDHFVLALVPRFAHALTREADAPFVPCDRWGDTVAILPDRLQGRPMRDLVTGLRQEVGESLRVGKALSQFPVALLIDADMSA